MILQAYKEYEMGMVNNFPLEAALTPQDIDDIRIRELNRGGKEKALSFLCKENAWDYFRFMSERLLKKDCEAIFKEYQPNNINIVYWEIGSGNTTQDKKKFEVQFDNVKDFIEAAKLSVEEYKKRK